MDIQKAALAGALVGVLVWHDVCISRQGRHIRHLAKLMQEHVDVTIQEKMDRKFDIITRGIEE